MDSDIRGTTMDEIETLQKDSDVDVVLSNGTRIEGWVERVDRVGIVVMASHEVEMPDETIAANRAVFVPWNKVEYIVGV